MPRKTAPLAIAFKAIPSGIADEPIAHIQLKVINTLTGYSRLRILDSARP
jgi:hypothetical protein